MKATASEGDVLKAFGTEENSCSDALNVLIDGVVVVNVESGRLTLLYIVLRLVNSNDRTE